MIVVKLEMWPGGREEGKYDLGRIEIANDAKTTLKDRTLGSYVVKLFKSTAHGATKPGIWRKGRVEEFPRKRLGAYDLVFRALQKVLGERNPLEDTNYDEIPEDEPTSTDATTE